MNLVYLYSTNRRSLTLQHCKTDFAVGYWLIFGHVNFPSCRLGASHFCRYGDSGLAAQTITLPCASHLAYTVGPPARSGILYQAETSK